jgi:ribosome-associated protein
LKPLTAEAYSREVSSVASLSVVSLGLSPGRWTERKGPLSDLAMSRAALHREPARVSTVRPDAEETLHVILACLDDAKAEDITTIDLRGKTSIGDYMVIATGRSNRHVGALADHVLEDLQRVGVPGPRVEGMPHCDWVLIDAGDVIVHVFRPEVRAFYNLEKMWAPGRSGARRAG